MPHVYRSDCTFQNLHTRKLGKIAVFFTVTVNLSNLPNLFDHEMLQYRTFWNFSDYGFSASLKKSFVVRARKKNTLVSGNAGDKYEIMFNDFN